MTLNNETVLNKDLNNNINSSFKNLRSKNIFNTNFSIIFALILSVLLCGVFIFSYTKLHKITQKSLISATQDKITLISKNTTSFLQKAKTLVLSNSASVEYLFETGCNNDDILKYLIYQTDFQLAKIDKSFTRLYGYYRGEYLDGNKWDPYENGGVYYPKERPWYLAGAKGNGQVSVASPYLDMDTGNIVLSITKMLSDGESVLGLDISLSNLTDYVNEYLVGNDFYYAYIIDKSGTIVASKDISDIGLNYFDKDKEKDSLKISDMFRRSLGSDLPFEYKINNKDYIVVSNSIENGWQIIAVTDSESIYAPLRRMAVMCIALLTTLIGVLLFFSIKSVYSNKLSLKAQEKEQKYITELQDFSDQLSSYKRAILSDALISFEVNLNKDELYYGVWKDDSGNVVPLNEIIGLNTPCSYDEYIKIWNGRFVTNYNNVKFSSSTDRQYLLEIYNSGKSEITFDYEAKTISGRKTWLRRSICMTKIQTGDIVAFTNVKDISAIVSQKKREEEFVRALATEYDSIEIIYFNENKFADKVIVRSRLSENFAKIVDNQTIKEEIFSKKLDHFLKYVHHEDTDNFYAETRREKVFESLAENKIHNVNFRLIKPDKSYLYYQIRFIPIKNDEGNLIGMIACMRNIDSETRKELEIRKTIEDSKIVAEAANQAKSTFLFNMSHDIRTPMNAIIGFTDIAEKHIDEKQRVLDALSKVKMSSNHLLSLINDVLDLSRVESGQIKIEKEIVFIDTAKDNLYSILASSAQAKNILFNATISSSVKHHWIYADRLRIMRILTNIISNSIKYTNPGGKIELFIDEVPCDREDYARYRFTVTDTGMGMSKEYLDHIFEPFSRAESATKSGITGTGLGMTITKSLVETLGGFINIESEIGVGTTVTIELENKITEPVHIQPTLNQTASDNLKGKKILLVEDNELNREIATEILEEIGVIVDVAEDGDIAVEKMKSSAEGQYDLILMDIQMPRMNGYDATRAIRALSNTYASEIPIVAMTANAFDEDKQNAFEVGMNGHLAKPIEIPKLMNTLYEIMK